MNSSFISIQLHFFSSLKSIIEGNTRCERLFHVRSRFNVAGTLLDDSRDTLLLIKAHSIRSANIVCGFIATLLATFSMLDTVCSMHGTKYIRSEFLNQMKALRIAFVCISCIAYAFCYFYTNNRKMFKPKVKDRSAFRRAFSFKKRTTVTVVDHTLSIVHYF